MLATFIVMILISTALPVLAEDDQSDLTRVPAMVLDVSIARPLGLGVMVIGAATYIVALPFAITTGSVGPVTRVLVVSPFNVTFTRPVGDFSSLEP